MGLRHVVTGGRVLDQREPRRPDRQLIATGTERWPALDDVRRGTFGGQIQITPIIGPRNPLTDDLIQLELELQAGRLAADANTVVRA